MNIAIEETKATWADVDRRINAMRQQINQLAERNDYLLIRNDVLTSTVRMLLDHTDSPAVRAKAREVIGDIENGVGQ